MRIYKCILTGEEMFTDIYPIRDYNDLLFEVEAKQTTKKTEGIDESLIGGNASQEEPQQESVDDCTTVSGLNVALNHHYCETGYGSKKEFIRGMGAYLKAIIAKKQESDPSFDATQFKECHQMCMKEHLIPKFADLQFFMGQSMNSDGTLAMLQWKKTEGSDQEVPVYYFFKSGLEIEKV